MKFLLKINIFIDFHYVLLSETYNCALKSINIKWGSQTKYKCFNIKRYIKAIQHTKQLNEENYMFISFVTENIQ